MPKKDRNKKWTRRKLLLSVGGAALGGLGYVRFLEPGWLDASVTKVEMSGQGLSKPIRILHLSDFHVSRVVPLALVKEAIEIGLGFQPDFVCLTGDFFTHQLTDVEKYRVQLEQLSGVAPTFACPGNHDGGAWVEKRGGYSYTHYKKDSLFPPIVIERVDLEMPVRIQTQSKLNPDSVREIRARAANGETQTSLAREYQVTQTLVSQVVLRKTWKYVTERGNTMTIEEKIRQAIKSLDDDANAIAAIRDEFRAGMVNRTLER